MVELQFVVPEALAGTRIAVTGATGFLGTAVVERLLRAVPDCELVLVVRPGRRSSAARRVEREILRNDAFGRLREQWGVTFDDEIARRVTVVGGDVSIDRLGLDDEEAALVASCDTIIHCAATVSFDSPIDTAVETNLVGPNRLLALAHEHGTTPHLISVSTCYIAGNRRGVAREEFLHDTPFHVDVDWTAEVEAARRARSDTDATSRTPERLAKFRKEARAELGPAGLPLLSEKTEQLRSRWVNDRIGRFVQIGGIGVATARITPPDLHDELAVQRELE